MDLHEREERPRISAITAEGDGARAMDDEDEDEEEEETKLMSQVVEVFDSAELVVLLADVVPMPGARAHTRRR